MSASVNSKFAGMAPPRVAVLIATSNPGRPLLRLTQALVEAGAPAILVVDDGSDAAGQGVLNRIGLEPTVHLLRHTRPLGHGAALKTGMQYLLEHLRHYTGLVTTTPGRYAADDVLRVAHALHRSPRLVILGARGCPDASNPFALEPRWRTPLRSTLLRVLIRLFTGIELMDAQTRLRALPTGLLPQLVRIPGARYDYELAMLLHLAHIGYPLAEHPLAAGADSGNDDSSSANPFSFLRALLNCTPEAEPLSSTPEPAPAPERRVHRKGVDRSARQVR